MRLRGRPLEALAVCPESDTCRSVRGEDGAGPVTGVVQWAESAGSQCAGAVVRFAAKSEETLACVCAVWQRS